VALLIGINLNEVQDKMLIEIFIFFEVVAIGLFIASFFTKQEILWAVTAVLTAVLMFTSFNVEYNTYQYNTSSFIYMPITLSYSYPYLMAINMLFFVLALVLGMFDLFEKYGSRVFRKPKQKDEE